MPSALTVFVDAPVLLQADDARDKLKQAQCRSWLAALWQRRSGRLSTQVLSEYYVNATRTLKLPQGDARAKVRRFQVWQPWQTDHQTVETAWGIEARFDLSYWDALVIASASQAGCSHVLSVNLEHGQHYGAVRIIDPFTSSINLMEKM